jgi:hypothetical protein
MNDDAITDSVIHDLQQMAISGRDVTSLLRLIQERCGTMNCKIMSVMFFRKAFGSDIAAIKDVTAWCGFGGPLSDSEVNVSVLPILEHYRMGVR